MNLKNKVLDFINQWGPQSHRLAADVIWNPFRGLANPRAEWFRIHEDGCFYPSDRPQNAKQQACVDAFERLRKNNKYI